MLNELIPRVQHLENEYGTLKVEIKESDDKLAELENKIEYIEQSIRGHQMKSPLPYINTDYENFLEETIKTISMTLWVHDGAFKGTQVHKLSKNKKWC